MSGATKLLEASGVPGQLCEEDKTGVATGFNALSRRESSPKASGLRIIDTLDSRFVFVVTHPRNVNLTLLKTLCRSIGGVRGVVLDVPRDCVRVECWRSSRPRKRRGKKRPRPVRELLQLPERLVEALQPCKSVHVHEVLLWILNRPEDFCTFDVDVEVDESAGAYLVRMSRFDAVTDAFLNDMTEQWRTVVKDVVVEWSRKSLTLVIAL